MWNIKLQHVKYLLCGRATYATCKQCLHFKHSEIISMYLTLNSHFFYLGKIFVYTFDCGLSAYGSHLL